MLIIEPERYRETIEIMEGNRVLAPVFKELQAWLLVRLNLHAVNFILEPLPGPGSGNRHRLYILLGSTEDYNRTMEPGRFGYAPALQAEIAARFTALALDSGSACLEQLENLWVCYNDFSKEIQSTINESCIADIRLRFRERYPDAGLWGAYTMGFGGVVFFLTDADVERNAADGTAEAMKRDWFGILKDADPLDQYHWETFDITFDSKENLDTHYQGNLYYYFK